MTAPAQIGHQPALDVCMVYWNGAGPVHTVRNFSTGELGVGAAVRYPVGGGHLVLACLSALNAPGEMAGAKCTRDGPNRTLSLCSAMS